MPEKKEERHVRERDLTYRLSEVGISLPVAIDRFAQKPRGKRNKNSVGKERPNKQQTPGVHKMANETQTVSSPQSLRQVPQVPHVPEAGGVFEMDQKIVQSFIPTIKELEKAGDKLSSAIGAAGDEFVAKVNQLREQEKKAETRRVLLNIGEFSAKSAIAVGVGTALMGIGRALWRGRNNHLVTE